MQIIFNRMTLSKGPSKHHTLTQLAAAAVVNSNKQYLTNQQVSLVLHKGY